MISLLGNAIDTMENIEYGILIAVVIDAILLVSIAASDSKKKLNALSYIIAIVLLVPLAYQMSRLIGACHVSETASAINDLVGAVSPTLSKYVSSATSESVGWFIFRRVMWSVLFSGVAGLWTRSAQEAMALLPASRPAEDILQQHQEDEDNNKE